MLTSTVVIATLNRPADLFNTLESWKSGIVLPSKIRVVDASESDATCQVCATSWEPLEVEYIRATTKSAACQRNQGATGCDTDLIVFCDDDVVLPADALLKFVNVFEGDPQARIGGVAGTIVGMSHSVPGRLLRQYYRIQAGYDHEHYGGHFFGPAINLLPVDSDLEPILFPSQWLNSTFVVYRTSLFAQVRFPEFPGYSYQEDVALSAAIGRAHRLYFHRGIRYVHKGYEKPANGAWESAFIQYVNRWFNASTLLHLEGFERSWKFLLSLIIDFVFLARTRPPGWTHRMLGASAAWWALAVMHHDAAAMALGGEVVTSLFGPHVVTQYHSAISKLRNVYYRRLGMTIDGYVWMRAIEIPRNWQDIRLEHEVSLDRGVVLLCSGPLSINKLIIHAGTYVNRYTMFDVHEHLEVGRNCMIGPHCYLTDADHSTALNSSVKAQPMRTAPVVIEDDVWIGAHVVVLKGVRIGTGAVIGAGSVVTSNIPAFSIAVGSPARVKRTRT